MPSDADVSESPKKPIFIRISVFFIKLSVTICALWLVVSQLDVEQFMAYLEQSHWGYMLAALLMLNVGQLFSSYRLRYYLSKHAIAVPAAVAIALYYIGMFFNHFLPGGVGGDGYKAWYIKKHYGLPYKKGVRLVLSARLNGLFALGILTAAMMVFSEEIQDLVPYFWRVFFGLLILGIVGYGVFAKFVLHEAYSVQAGAFWYSFWVQLANVLTVVCILKGLQFEGEILNYLIVFMVACVASIIPISLGGVGLRELTFLVSAELVGLDVEIGVAIALLYFVINALASLVGIVFFYKHKAG